MSKFLPTHDHHACKACGDTSGKCRWFADNAKTILCMTTTGKHDCPEGLEFIKMSKCGGWAVLRVLTHGGGHSTVLERRVAADDRKRRDEEVRLKMTSLIKRNEIIRAKVAKLTQHQHASLLRRGLTHREIFKLLEEGMVWEEKNGFAIGITDPVTGYFVGAQICNDRGGQKFVREGKTVTIPKYKWLMKGDVSLPETREVPLAVWISPDFDWNLPAEIKFCEGILKSLIAALIDWRDNPQAIWIGGSGGNFGENSLNRILSYLPLSESTTYTLYPDAGAVRNRHVMASYSNLVKLIGSELRVAWWDQRNDNALDCDELTGQEVVQLIPFNHLTKMHERLMRPSLGVTRKANLSAGKKEFTEVVHKIPESERLVAFIGRKATKKSGAIGELVKNKSFLAVTPKRSLARAQADDWGGTFLQDGDRFHDKILTKCGTVAKSVSVVYPSLMATDGFDADVLVVDETTAGMSFLLSSRLCNKDGRRGPTIDSLVVRVRAAKRVVLADADMTDAVIAWFELVMGVKAYIVTSDRVALGYEVFNMTCPGKDAFAEFIRQAQQIPEGMLVYLNMDEKNRVDLAEDVLAFLGIKSLKITAETSGDELQRRLIESHGRILPELAAQGIKVILSSPSITQGFSLTQNTDMFVSRWGIYSGRSITAEDMAQSPDRIRANTPLYLWVAEYGMAYSKWGRSTDPKQWLQEFKAQGSLSAKLVRHSLSHSAIEATDDYDWGNIHNQLLASVESGRNRGMSNLREAVLDLLEHDGKTITHYEPMVSHQEVRDCQQLITASAGKIKLRHAIAVQCADDLLPEEFINLKAQSERRQLSRNEQYSMSKHQLKKFYRLSEVAMEDVMKDCGDRMKSAVKSLERTVNCRLAALHTANSIEKNMDTPQDWTKDAILDQLFEVSGFKQLTVLIMAGKIDKLTDDLIGPIYERLKQNSELWHKCFGNQTVESAGVNKVMGKMLSAVGIKTKIYRHNSDQRIYRIDQEHLTWLRGVLYRRETITPESFEESLSNRGVILNTGLDCVEEKIEQYFLVKLNPDLAQNLESAPHPTPQCMVS